MKWTHIKQWRLVVLCCLIVGTLGGCADESGVSKAVPINDFEATVQKFKAQVVAFWDALWADERGVPKAVEIKVFGAREGGAYQVLVDEFQARAEAFWDACKDDPKDPKCNEIGELTFKHEPTKGSIENLENLGMTKEEKQEEKQEKKEEPTGPQITYRFALVQNDVIFQAGNGDLEFESMQKYAKFEDLRIVLPMYNSMIQVVTALPDELEGMEKTEGSPKDSDNCTIAINHKFRSLCKKRIYLGDLQSVNRRHGEAFLDLHPQLVGKNRPTYICSKVESKDKLESKEMKFVDCSNGAPYLISEKPLSITKPEDCDLEDFLLAKHKIDAYVISGTLKPFGKLSELYSNPECLDSGADGLKREYRVQLEIPELIIDSVLSEMEPKETNWFKPLSKFDQLRHKYPYYQKLKSPSSLGEKNIPETWSDYNFPQYLPAVTTYLVTTESVSANTVRRVTLLLLDQWTNLMLSDEKLAPIAENLLRIPVPRHSGAEQALIEKELIGTTVSMIPLISWSVIFLLALSLYPKTRYNRVGGSYRTAEIFSFWIRSFLKIALSIVFILLAVRVVQDLESSYAVQVNAKDPIGNFDFPGALLWMFTFIASGYENEVFPISPWSQLLVTLLALTGLALPLAVIIGIFNKLRDLRQDRERGRSDPGRLRNHTLICGWNSRGPGLLYTLTSRSSTHRGRIVIIANIDEELPLKRWRLERRGRWYPYRTGWFWFSFQRVLYLRGDPAQRKTLEKADVQRASTAIILASKHDQDVLTSLALRKLNEKIFIVAELGAKEDEAHYNAEKVNQIVDPDRISLRMTAIACFGPRVVDFALDAMSPGKRGSEWYSLQARTVAKNLPEKNPTLNQYIHELRAQDISVIGVSDRKVPVLSDTTSLDDTRVQHRYGPLTSSTNLDRILNHNDRLICASKDFRSYTRSFLNPIRRRFQRKPSGLRFDDKRIFTAEDERKVILLIGPEHRSADLAIYLKPHLPSGYLETLSDQTGDGFHASDQQILDLLHSRKDWTHVVIMSSARHGAAEFGAGASEADAQTILRAQLIHTYFEDRQQAGGSRVVPRLIAEMLDAGNRQLFEDADVETIVPTSIMIERLLARLASGRGHVSSMLLAMMRLEEGVFIRSLELESGNALIGCRFADSLSHFYADGRVIGLLPANPERAMQNEYGDFSHHFYMCPAKKDVFFQQGDTVIILTNATPRSDA